MQEHHLVQSRVREVDFGVGGQMQVMVNYSAALASNDTLKTIVEFWAGALRGLL